MIVASESMPAYLPALICLWCGTVMCAENYFLIRHIKEGISLSSWPIYDFSAIPLRQLPRIFRNVRDGNSIAILSIASGFCTFSMTILRSWISTVNCGRPSVVLMGSLILAIFSAAMGFFHALITEARGVFLSILVGIIFLSIAVFTYRKNWRSLWRNIWFLSISFLLALASYKLYLGGEPVNTLTSRFNAVISNQASSPRLLMWTQAIEHRLNTHIVLGEGFNFHLAPPFGGGAMDPHNILVMLFLYAGIAGLIIFFLLLVSIIRFFSSQEYSNDLECSFLPQPQWDLT